MVSKTSISYGCLSIREVLNKTRRLFGNESNFESVEIILFLHTLLSFPSSRTWMDTLHPNGYGMEIRSECLENHHETNDWISNYRCVITTIVYDGRTSNRARMFLTSFMRKDLSISPFEIE